MKHFLLQLFSFRGTMTRSSFWLLTARVLICLCLPCLNLLLALPLMLCLSAAVVRRLHDTGRSSLAAGAVILTAAADIWADTANLQEGLVYAFDAGFACAFIYLVYALCLKSQPPAPATDLLQARQ